MSGPRHRIVAVAVAAALAAATAVVTSGTVGAAPSPAPVSAAAARIADRVPAPADGGSVGGVAVLDVDAQTVLPVTTTADGAPGSLREAIETFATSIAGDTVVLAPGATYVLTCGAGGTITHGNTPLEIEGNGATITMESGCEQGLLDNGTGALVVRDVQFTDLDLAPTTRITAIVETGGPFTLAGGRVADNTVDSGALPLDGLFFARGDVPGDVVVEGTTFARNTRRDGGDCGIFCVVGDLSVRSTAFADTRVEAASGCGGLVCITGDTELIDTTVATTTNGGTSHCGGLVCMDGTLSLVRSTVTGTVSEVSTPGSICGGIVCGTHGLALTDSSITGTAVTDDADEICGAVLCVATSGDLTLVRSTLAGTTATLSGGSGGNDCAAMVCGVDTIRAVNSTIADNVTTGGATLRAAFAADTGIELVYVTFVGNAGSGLSAVAPAGDAVAMSAFGSVLAGSGSGGTCAAGLDVTSNGFSWADDASCGLTGTGDRQVPGGDPQLAALADNGGPGPTLLPAAASPLVDAIPAASCRADGAAGVTTDERGEPRPSVSGPSCDIGAVERGPAPVVVTPTFTG